MTPPGDLPSDWVRREVPNHEGMQTGAPARCICHATRLHRPSPLHLPSGPWCTRDTPPSPSPRHPRRPHPPPTTCHPVTCLIPSIDSWTEKKSVIIHESLHCSISTKPARIFGVAWPCPRRYFPSPISHFPFPIFPRPSSLVPRRCQSHRIEPTRQNQNQLP